MTVPTIPADDRLVDDMLAFVVAQGDGRTDETRRRYAAVAAELEAFLAAVDVGPWLGPELAAHLERQRVHLGRDALVTTLGLLSLIRVLPAFVQAPWLPPPGAERKTHRVAVRRLATFLRQRAHQAGCLRRQDFAALIDAVGHSSYDADPPMNRTGRVTCTVTLDLVEHLVDRLLEQVTEGRFETFDEALAARINPVQVTVWREPGYDDYRW